MTVEMINLHESMGPGQDQTGHPWICSQTHYQLCYAAQLSDGVYILLITIAGILTFMSRIHFMLS